jgi:thioredoxin 1
MNTLLPGISLIEFEQSLQGELPVLIDFYATWCEPCGILDTILAELEPRLDKKAEIIKMDIDQHPEISAHYGIRSVPTLMIFKKGEMVWRMAGFKLAHELEEDIRSFM